MTDMAMYWHEVEIHPLGSKRTVDRLCWRGGELVKPSQPHVWYETEQELDGDLPDVVEATRREVYSYLMLHEAVVWECCWDEDTDDETRCAVACVVNE